MSSPTCDAARVPPAEVIRRLAATTRPYFAWAAAWSYLLGRRSGDPDDERTLRALEALRSIEPAVSALEHRLLAVPGSAVSRVGGRRR